MRDLIKKILYEYTSENYKIEIVDLTGILTESEIKLVLEGKATVQVPNSIISLVDGEIEKINNGNNGFKGVAINKKTGQERYKIFFMKTTYHYLQRLFRTEEPEYKSGKMGDYKKIVNPSLFEGIELVYRAANALVEYHISNEPMTHLFKKLILIKTYKPDGVMNVLVEFEKSNKRQDAYEIVLKTQLKGPEFKGTQVGGRTIKKIDKKITI